ncbi:MAG: hypothetical protein V2A72_02230 [Candidatus Omnitrophota bacterium]
MHKKYVICLYIFYIAFVDSFVFADAINTEQGNDPAKRAIYIVQEPRGATMDLVLFKPKKLKLPYAIKYPSQWYAAEIIVGAPTVLLSREPIRKQSDEYKMGIAIYYMTNYFRQVLPRDSELGKMAKVVISVEDWEQSKNRFLAGFQKQADVNILSKTDITLSDLPAFKVEYQVVNPYDKLQVVAYFIRAGNHLLNLIYEAPISEFEEYREIFEAAISSFKFNNAEAN